MKKYLILLIFVFALCGCSENEKEYSEVKTEEILNDESDEIDYSKYNGIWSEGGINHSSIMLGGGTEFHIEVKNKNELSGYLFSQQYTSERVAEIDEISGEIIEKECYYDFDDDGWEGSGTLYIKFLQDEILIEVLNYKMSDSNLCGYGISGFYKLTRMKESNGNTEASDIPKTT